MKFVRFNGGCEAILLTFVAIYGNLFLDRLSIYISIFSRRIVVTILLAITNIIFFDKDAKFIFRLFQKCVRKRFTKIISKVKD